MSCCANRASRLLEAEKENIPHTVYLTLWLGIQYTVYLTVKGVVVRYTVYEVWLLYLLQKRTKSFRCMQTHVKTPFVNKRWSEDSKKLFLIPVRRRSTDGPPARWIDIIQKDLHSANIDYNIDLLLYYIVSKGVWTPTYNTQPPPNFEEGHPHLNS